MSLTIANCWPYPVATDCPGCAPSYGQFPMPGYRPHKFDCPVAVEAREKQRQRDHHEAVLMFVRHRLENTPPTSGGELAEWAHLMADYLYPPPDAVFDPPLRHHRNPPPKAEGT